MNLSMEKICKSFGANNVLTEVNFSLAAGEICALLGENGAGKSTLMKILSGAYQKDEGEIYFDGEKVEINTSQDAQRLCISTIYQELNLTEQLTVAENIFMGRQIMKNRFMVDWKKMYAEAQKLLDEGCVLHNAKPGKKNQKLNTGDEITVTVPTPNSRCQRVRLVLISRIRYSSTSSSLMLRKPTDRNSLSSERE